MKNITILHVFEDSNFLDIVADFFDAFDHVTNIYAFYTKEPQPAFQLIKNTGRLKIFTNRKEYMSLFHADGIDAVYFHSLKPQWYKYFNHIDKKKTIFWWSWGFDIYTSWIITSPFVKLNFLKPLTLQSYNQYGRKNAMARFIAKFAYYPFTWWVRKKVLSRIDYFSPVISIDYDLMKEQNACFHAKPFMVTCGPGLGELEPFKHKEHSGNVLVGNSLTWGNNYLDVFEYLYKLNLANNGKYIIPISYGKAYGGKENLKQSSRFKNNQVCWLDGFMPRDEYFQLFDSISHAVFGVVRQQAIGNISFCLTNGIKLFFFKDSVVYKYLKNQGYIVYTIDDDLNNEAISSVLSYEEAKHNYDIQLKYRKNKTERAQQELQEIFGD